LHAIETQSHSGPKEVWACKTDHGFLIQVFNRMAIADIIAADRVVCRCLGITESEIRSALIEGTGECLRTIMRETGAGTGCTCCHRAIRDLLDRERLQEQLSAQCEGSASSPTCVTR
jgi:bacterioferritin-associated ferredoxin